MHFQHSIPFTPAESFAILAALPETPAIFRLRGDEPNAEPYINKAASLRKRLERLLSPASPDSKRLNLREATRSIEYTLTGSDFENRLLLYRVLREHFPRSYRKRMKIIPAALVKIGWENEYPRAYFTRRLGRIPHFPKSGTVDENPPFPTSGRGGVPAVSIYYGPFASKAVANKFLNDALDLFKSRRCTFNLRPDPSFPGCVYSEMKMCLAPCFAGCTDEEYMSEVGRVQDYLDTRAGSLVTRLEAERDAASADLRFEDASALHARVEKAKAPWSGMSEIVGRVDHLRAVIVQRSALEDHVALFEYRDGLLNGPVQFNVRGMQHPNPASGSSSLFSHPHVAQPMPLEAPVTSRPQTLEARVAEALSQIKTCKPERGEIADHLALLKRWYYRSTKKGEMFITHSGELPLRRIVRGISRVFRGEKEPDVP
jgi:excinuclease UvrABC nuclease subunit